MAPSLIELPRDIFISNLLPMLDVLDIYRLYCVSVEIRSIINDYLKTIKSIDMTKLFDKIEEAARFSMISAVTARNWKNKFLAFLTKTATCLKKIKVVDKRSVVNYWGREKQSIDIKNIINLIRMNRNLKEVTLVNLNMSIYVRQLIADLPKIKYFEVTSDLYGTSSFTREPLVGDKFTSIIEDLKKKGCTVKIVDRRNNGAFFLFDRFPELRSYIVEGSLADILSDIRRLFLEY